MNREEFYRIVKTEGLNKYNIADSVEIPKAANVIGCTSENGNYYLILLEFFYL